MEKEMVVGGEPRESFFIVDLLKLLSAQKDAHTISGY